MRDQVATTSQNGNQVQRNAGNGLGIIELRHVAVFALMFPALMLTMFAAGHGTLPGDVYISRLIQDSFPTSLGWLTKAVNTIGSTLGAIVTSVAIGAALIAVGFRAGGLLVLATLVVRPFNELLKLAAGSPRPEPMRVEVVEFADGLGFPSGHVSGAMLLYGSLFYLAPRLSDSPRIVWSIRIGSGLMIVLMGLSRIHVGAHWPSDVLGGYLWGAIALSALISIWHLARRVIGPGGQR